jgi:hypothetical protein
LVDGSNILNGAKYKLPPSIRAACGGEYEIENSGIVNTVIPEGILYLKNATTGEIYSDGVYRYINDSSVKVEEVELDLNDSYYFITVGTDLTSSIEDLYNKLAEHTHDGEFGEKRVSAGSIKGIYSEFMSEEKSYLPSKRKGNYFSQYLHRDGVILEDPHCDENAMRGNLLIGKELSAPGTHVGSGTSYDIRFSENSNRYSIKRVTAGDRSGIVTKASKFNNDVSKSESQLWNDGIMKLDATDRVEIFSQNGTFFDGGIINRSSGSGLASEVGGFTDPGQTWYHAKISNVTWNMRNKKVYARQYTLGTVDEEDYPRLAILNSNGMFLNKAIELPSCLEAENFSNIVGVDIVVSPGASATAWQDPNYPRNDDSKTVFGSSAMIGGDQSVRHGLVWKLWQGGDGIPGYLLLSVPLYYDGKGAINPNFLSQDQDGYFFCWLDISVTIRYRTAG